MSGDPEQEYFADGMVEEIITALSRFHWLFVIARTSTFTYKGRPFELQDKMTASVVGAIAPTLERAEIERIKRKPTESLDAYDCFLRGTSRVYQWTREANDEALQFSTAL
jgi:hypothetical protein